LHRPGRLGKLSERTDHQLEARLQQLFVVGWRDLQAVSHAAQRDAEERFLRIVEPRADDGHSTPLLIRVATAPVSRGLISGSSPGKVVRVASH